jgi:hypothetical protein
MRVPGSHRQTSPGKRARGGPRIGRCRRGPTPDRKRARQRHPQSDSIKVTVHGSRATRVQGVSSREVASRMRRSIRPKQVYTQRRHHRRGTQGYGPRHSLVRDRHGKIFWAAQGRVERAISSEARPVPNAVEVGPRPTGPLQEPAGGPDRTGDLPRPPNREGDLGMSPLSLRTGKEKGQHGVP